MKPEKEVAQSCARVALELEPVSQLIATLERLLFSELVPNCAAGKGSLGFQNLMLDLYSRFSNGEIDLPTVKKAFNDVIQIPEIAESCAVEAIIFAVERVRSLGTLNAANARVLAKLPWSVASNQLSDELKCKTNDIASDIQSFLHEVDDGFVAQSYNDKELLDTAAELSTALRCAV